MKRASTAAIAANELFGAILVPLAIAAALSQRPGALPTWYLAFALTGAAVAGLAGLLLLLGWKWGWALSLFVQTVQVVGYANPNYSAHVEFGFKIGLEFTSSGFMSRWGFGGQISIGPLGGIPEPTFYVNVLALVALIFLIASRRHLTPGHEAAAPVV